MLGSGLTLKEVAARLNVRVELVWQDRQYLRSLPPDPESDYCQSCRRARIHPRMKVVRTCLGCYRPAGAAVSISEESDE